MNADKGEFINKSVSCEKTLMRDHMAKHPCLIRRHAEDLVEKEENPKRLRSMNL